MMYGTPSRDELLKLIATVPGAQDPPVNTSQYEFSKMQLARKREQAFRDAAPILAKSSGERAAILAANGNLQAAILTGDPFPCIQQAADGGFICTGCGENLGTNTHAFVTHAGCGKSAAGRAAADGQLYADPPPPWGGTNEWGAPAPDTAYAVRQGQLPASPDPGWRPAPGVVLHDPVNDRARTAMANVRPVGAEAIYADWGKNPLVARLNQLIDRAVRAGMSKAAAQEQVNSALRAMRAAGGDLQKARELVSGDPRSRRDDVLRKAASSPWATLDGPEYTRGQAESMVKTMGAHAAVRKVRELPDQVLEMIGALKPGHAAWFRQFVLDAAVAAEEAA